MSSKHRILAIGYFVIVASLIVLAAGCQQNESKPASAEQPDVSTPVSQQASQASMQPVEKKTEGFQLGKVDGISANDRQLFPAGKFAITLTKGENDSEKIITSGLDNVGVGSYVYLEGRDKDARDFAIKSWSWQVEAPDGSKVTLENASSKNSRFLASQLGEYKVKITTTNEKGEQAGSEFRVYAGRYVGASLCISCHNGSVSQDIASKWKATGHATKFEVTYGSYSKESDYCIRCHTTGFDESADNGGFDDMAKAAGWDSTKDGSVVTWMKAKNMTLEDLKKDPRLSVFMNIQCESCHGPGGTRHTGSKSYEVGVCTQCHTAQLSGWNYSSHSKEVGAEFRENESCVECHTGQGFVTVKVRGQKPVLPARATKENPANLPSASEMLGQTCATCHDPHEAKNPIKTGDTTRSLQLRMLGGVNTPSGVKVEAGTSAVCVSCHANKRDNVYKTDYLAGKKTRGSHENSQTDVFYGFGALDFGRTFESSPHGKLVKDGCVSCHMAKNPVEDNGTDGNPGTRDDVLVQSVGNHSFSVAGDWKFKDKMQTSRVENVAICQNCHNGLDTFNRKANGDYDGNGKIEGVQTEIEGLLKLVEAKLPKDDKGQILTTTINERDTNELQRKALWNYYLIKNDGSRGVHNTIFAVQVLQQSYKALTSSDVPGATLR